MRQSPAARHSPNGEAKAPARVGKPPRLDESTGQRVGKPQRLDVNLHGEAKARPELASLHGEAKAPARVGKPPRLGESPGQRVGRPPRLGRKHRPELAGLNG